MRDVPLVRLWKSRALRAGFGARLLDCFVDQALGVLESGARCVRCVFGFAQLVQRRIQAAIFDTCLIELTVGLALLSDRKSTS